MADSLQKIDRLIEGQGKLVEGQGRILEIATRADQKADITAHKLDITVQKVDIVAKGVAELTISTQRQYEDLKAGQEAIMQYLREKLP